MIYFRQKYIVTCYIFLIYSALGQFELAIRRYVRELVLLLQEPPSSQTKATYRQSGAIAPVLADSDPHFWLDNKGSKPLSGLEYFWKIPNGRKA